VKWLAVVVVAAVAADANAQPQHLDRGELAGGPVEAEPPQIELLTFGVGERIFEKYGHSAICLRYHDPRISAVCFNYGVTDFGAGKIMIWNFLRGTQRFWVEPTTYGAMVNFYKWEDRDIWSQIIPVGPSEARALEAKLWAGLADDVKFYNYDHFFDNCSTKLRDMIDDATHGKLRAGTDTAYPLTFRQMGVDGLSTLPPLIALTDFVIGRQADDTPSIWEAMFHPAVLRLQVASQLGVPPRLVYRRMGPELPQGTSTWRWQMLAIGFAFSFPLAIAVWRRRFVRVAVAWAALYLTVWGVVIWGLAIISSIPGIRWNELVLVFVPFDVVLPFLSGDRRRHYARLRVLLLTAVSLLAVIGILHQPIWVPLVGAFVPLALIGFGD
jgi:hypothetical protein